LTNHFFEDYLILLKNFQMGTWKVQECSFACIKDRDSTPSEKIALNVNNMAFTSVLNKVPLASTIQKISLQANVSMPTRFEGTIATTLKNWYDQEGIIDLTKMDIVWGDIRLEGNGSLSLDQDLQPLGAFTVKL